MPEPAAVAAPVVVPAPVAAPTLALRPAGPADCRFVWATRNEPSARAVSLSSEPIPYADHEQWWDSALADPATLILVVEEPALGPAGYVRFRIDNSAGNAEAEISIALTPATRGRGLGSTAIQLACAHLFASGRATHILARVSASNGASLAAFGAAGFVSASTSGSAYAVLGLTQP